ncbi:MAG TPA: RNA polymerase sigma factor [Phycisphaerae bacterium]|nr:RNA polymerase sigma factor [Phycisphaerae bacterium]HOI56645.1 RNA polymerase sigma factor [Phycisphaerae bacterium]
MSENRTSSTTGAGCLDRAAWADVVHGHYDRVFRTAMARTNCRALAEEVAQETFIRAWQKYHLFDGRGSLAGWLHRIAVNLSCDALRRERLHDHRCLGEARQNAGGELRPPDVVHRDHCCRVLREALNDIPESMRRAFEYTVIMGYSYREAADIEGVPEGTIASRVARARNTLLQRYRRLDA